MLLGSSPGRCSGRPRSGSPSNRCCRPAASPTPVPLTVTVTDLDSGELLLFGAGARDAPLVDVLAAIVRPPLYFPPVAIDGRRCGDGVSGACCRSRPRPMPGSSRWSRWTWAPGWRPRPARPPSGPRLVQAHDEAVGTLMAAHTAGAARSLAGRAGRDRRSRTSGRRSSATLPSGWSACGSMRSRAIAPRARRSPAAGART